MRKNNILFISAFIMNMVITGISFGYIFLLSDRFTFSAGMVGFFLTLGYGGYMLGCELYRRIGSRFDPRFCIPAAVIIMTSSALIIWLSSFSVLTAFTWTLYSCTTAFFWPPLMGWITKGLNGKELNRDLGRFNQSWTIGSLLGPAASGFLYSRSARFAFLFFTASLAVLAVFFIISVLFHQEMRAGGRIKNDSTSSISEQPGKTKSRISNQTPLRFPSWTGIFSAYVFFGVVANILPLEIRNVLGYSEQVGGNLLLVRGIASLAGFTFLGKTLKWHFNKKWILFSQGMMILLPFIFLPGHRSIAFYVAAITVFGFFFAANYSNSIFHGCAGVADSSGRMAVHEGILTAGAAFGSFAGGVFYQHWGITGAVFFIAGTTLCGFVVSWLLMAVKRERIKT